MQNRAQSMRKYLKTKTTTDIAALDVCTKLAKVKQQMINYHIVEKLSNEASILTVSTPLISESLN